MSIFLLQRLESRVAIKPIH